MLYQQEAAERFQKTAERLTWLKLSQRKIETKQDFFNMCGKAAVGDSTEYLHVWWTPGLFCLFVNESESEDEFTHSLSLFTGCKWSSLALSCTLHEAETSGKWRSKRRKGRRPEENNPRETSEEQQCETEHILSCGRSSSVVTKWWT